MTHQGLSNGARLARETLLLSVMKPEGAEDCFQEAKLKFQRMGLSV